MPRRSSHRRRSRSSRARVRRDRPPGVNPAFWDATQNRKQRGNYAAFTAPRDHTGRVMVVRNRRSGEWMLPGGLANLGEHSHETAKRETREESGLSLGTVRKVHTHDDVALFDAPRAVSRSHRRRVATFHNRKDKRETSDYGFVDPHAPVLRVTSYDGRPKERSKSFRKGSVHHLRRL